MRPSRRVVVLEVNTAKDRGGIKREKGVSEGKRRFYWRTNFRRSISVRHHSFREFIFLSTLSKGIKSTNKRLPPSPSPFFVPFLLRPMKIRCFIPWRIFFPLACLHFDENTRRDEESWDEKELAFLVWNNSV